MPISETELVAVLLAERAHLLAYVRTIVNDRELAEDVFQAVCLAAVGKRTEIREAGALPTWFRKAARLEALAALRAARRQPVALSEQTLDLLDAHWETTGEQPQQLRAAALSQCIDKLTDNNRELLAMRYQQGLKTGEIAKQLGRQVNSVYVALSRIHVRLRECVKQNLRKEATGDG